MNSVKVNLDGIGSFWHEHVTAREISFSTIFLTAWGILLRTYLNTNQVFFEYKQPRCENLRESDGISELIINLRPCILNFDGSPTANDMVYRAESVLYGAHSVRDDFEHEIHRETETNRGTFYNTCMVFSAGAQFQSDTTDRLAYNGVDAKHAVNHDMTVYVVSEKLCILLYKTHCFADDQAAHVAAALETVFKSVADAPHRLIREIEVLSQLDKDKLLKWNASPPIASETCLHDLVHRQCDLNPDLPAVIAWDGSFTYKELDSLSSFLAKRLHAARVGPDVFVTICANRCKWIPVAMLGIIKAGGAFCALDLSHPLDRLREMCDALKSTITVTTSTESKEASQLASNVIVIDESAQIESSGADPKNEQPKLSNAHSRNALYAVFTSGSSGKPKGVVIEHRSFSSTALASLQPLDIRPDDRVLHFAAYAFDLSIFEILTPLMSGASVVIPSEKDRRESLAHAVKEFGATWAFLTPTVARMYQPDDFPSLRTLSLGGELIQTSDIALWGSKNLVTGYNPAESCPLGISGPAKLSEARFLGWSFSSQAAWIVDPEDYNKLMPVGAIGELLIEGPAVARGYIHDSSGMLPESPFIHSPPSWLFRFRSKISSDTRLYRTGDLVRYGHDASIYYIGRKDSQIKIRGQRIEPGEIECQLHSALSYDKFRVAIEAVELRGSSKIIAFLSKDSRGLESDDDAVGQIQLEVATRELEICIANATSRLQNIMPAYMIPSTFLSVNYIPISRSGKIDRRRLKSFALSLPRETLLRANGPETGDLPKSNDELRLQRIFSLVLGIPLDNIRVDSDFFRLGGDSLQAMKLLALAPKEGLSNLLYEDIFRYPRLKDMAKASESNYTKKDVTSWNSSCIRPFSLVIDDVSLIDIATKQCGIKKEAIEDIYPCTPMQASIMGLTVTGKVESFSTFIFTLKDHIDVMCIKEAWYTVHKASPLLRTRIICGQTGGLYQVVVKEDFFWDEGRYGNVVCRESRPSVGFGVPLVQLYLVKGQLVVTIHRALYDAWSFPHLLNEVSDSYCGLPSRPRPHFNYYVSYIAKSLDSAVSFWRAELEDSDPAQFPKPTLHKYKPGPRACLGIRVPTKQECDDIMACKLRLAWAVTTYARTNNKDVIFGVLSSGRNISMKGAEEIPGPISTITPLRVMIDGTQDVGEALEELQYRGEEQAMYSHLGLRRIGQLGQNATAACQFQTVLAVELNLPELKGAWFKDHVALHDHAETGSYLLTIKCVIRPNHVDIVAIFDQQDLPELEVQHILSQFEYIFRQVHRKRSSKMAIADIDTANFEDWTTFQKLSIPMTSDGCDGINLRNKDVLLNKTINHGGVETAICTFHDSLEEAAVATDEKPRSNSRGSGTTQFSTEPSYSVDLISEINRYDLAITRAHHTLGSDQLSGPDVMVEQQNTDTFTVFLTGANGFIGTQILRQCLEDKKISRVIALVRGGSAKEARSRTEESARRAQWWSDCHGQKLDVWPGDLSLPQLGLGQTHWSLLEDGRTVSVIIHNGASVHWLKSYADLEATNVCATAQLLQLAVRNPHLRFVYVSSGRYKDPIEEVEELAAVEIAAAAIPYSQTKFVAESLVRRATARMPRGHSNLAVVSLGLIIGDSSAGVVNVDDYLWRLLAACIKAGMYNTNAVAKWIPISDVTSTAKTIIKTALEPAGVTATVKPVTGGLTWREIWDMVSEMGYDIEPMPESEWMATVRRDIETEQEKHPLWTLSHMVESQLKNAEPAWADSWRGDEVASLRLRMAFKRSLQFLCQVGFLPEPVGQLQNVDREINRSAFARSW
uniref:Lysergyl peptide synthetase subunit 3 LPS3 n=1 Tax=Periglandula ipomoeae TaxID=1037530 RepID=G9FM52_9HYPO|nr:lysergyl peptide synthetase subunit 3 LPS3 [Periglandula ipomoeae]